MEEIDEGKLKEFEKIKQDFFKVKEDIDSGKQELSGDPQFNKNAMKCVGKVFSIISKILYKKKDENPERRHAEVKKDINNWILEIKQELNIDLDDISEEMKKAENGDPEAQFRLHNHYYMKEQYDEAKKWLIKSAENDYPEAIDFLAYCYQKGNNGFEKDKEKAIEWLEKLSKSDNPKIAKKALERLQQLKEES